MPGNAKTFPNYREIGARYEAMAADYLEKKGYEILDRNFHHHRNGEIDLMARQGKYLVCVEVKYRAGVAHGDPLEAVTFKKRLALSRLALAYLMKKGYPMDTPLRFDVIGIYGDDGEIRHIENAFEYTSFS